MFLSPTTKNRRNSRGSVLGVVVAAIILIIVLVSTVRMFAGSSRIRELSKEREAANLSASKKLEELMNLSFVDPELSDGNHPGSLFSWEITSLPPGGRLKKIVVRANLQHSVSRAIATATVGIEGYKYYDF